MSRSIALTIAFAIILLGCKITKDVSEECMALRLDQLEYTSAKTDRVLIKSAEVDGDCLRVRFVVEGACDPKSIRAHWDYRVKKSKPPIAKIKVSYTGKTNCSSKTEFTRSFNLKEMMNPAYDGKVLIQVNDYSEKLELNY
jgi:hypothetical protein